MLLSCIGCGVKRDEAQELFVCKAHVRVNEGNINEVITQGLLCPKCFISAHWECCAAVEKPLTLAEFMDKYGKETLNKTVKEAEKRVQELLEKVQALSSLVSDDGFFLQSGEKMDIANETLSKLCGQIVGTRALLEDFFENQNAPEDEARHVPSFHSIGDEPVQVKQRFSTPPSGKFSPMNNEKEVAAAVKQEPESPRAEMATTGALKIGSFAAKLQKVREHQGMARGQQTSEPLKNTMGSEMQKQPSFAGSPQMQEKSTAEVLKSVMNSGVQKQPSPAGSPQMQEKPAVEKPKNVMGFEVQNEVPRSGESKRVADKVAAPSATEWTGFQKPIAAQATTAQNVQVPPAQPPQVNQQTKMASSTTGVKSIGFRKSNGGKN